MQYFSSHSVPFIHVRKSLGSSPSRWSCLSRTVQGFGTGSHPYPIDDWIGSTRVHPFRSGARSGLDLDTCPACPSEGTRGGDLEGNNRVLPPRGTPSRTGFQPYWLRTVDSGNTPVLLERNPRLLSVSAHPQFYQDTTQRNWKRGEESQQEAPWQSCTTAGLEENEWRLNRTGSRPVHKRNTNKNSI